MGRKAVGVLPAGGSMITAGDDISIAWGELSGMPRYGIEEMCANVDGTDVGTTKPSSAVTANGSSKCIPIADCVEACARRIER